MGFLNGNCSPSSPSLVMLLFSHLYANEESLPIFVNLKLLILPPKSILFLTISGRKATSPRWCITHNIHNYPYLSPNSYENICSSTGDGVRKISGPFACFQFCLRFVHCLVCVCVCVDKHELKKFICSQKSTKTINYGLVKKVNQVLG